MLRRTTTPEAFITVFMHPTSIRSTQNGREPDLYADRQHIVPLHPSAPLAPADLLGRDCRGQIRQRKSASGFEYSGQRRHPDNYFTESAPYPGKLHADYFGRNRTGSAPDSSFYTGNAATAGKRTFPLQHPDSRRTNQTGRHGSSEPTACGIKIHFAPSSYEKKSYFCKDN